MSVIIPTWNEEKIIYENLKKIERLFDRTLQDYEIIVVDDGSTDKSYSEARRAAKESARIKVVRYMYNGGKGTALSYGFKFCSGEFVAFLDADLDLHPKQIPKFLSIIRKQNVDTVVGSKRHPRSKINYPLVRKLLSQTYNLIVRFLFSIKLTDTQSGIKVFKYKVLKEVLPIILCKKYAFDLELLVNIKEKGYKIAEAPIELLWRRNKNRLTLGDIWKVAIDTAAIYYRMKILKYYERSMKKGE